MIGVLSVSKKDCESDLANHRLINPIVIRFRFKLTETAIKQMNGQM